MISSALPDLDARAVAARSARAGDARYAARVRPIRAGYSFGLARRVGTAGLVVRRRQDGRRALVLSSSHVLNDRPDGRDYPLYQPAGKDAPRGLPPVGRAVQFTRLHPRRANRTEAGLAELFEHVGCDASHPLGPLHGVCTDLRVGQPLYKVSRTTGTSEGVVMDLSWRGAVRFGARRYPFERQVLIHNPSRPISLEGDSGAVWLTEDGEVAALNFAGSSSGHWSISSPLAPVFRRLALCLPAAWV